MNEADDEQESWRVDLSDTSEVNISYAHVSVKNIYVVELLLTLLQLVF